MGWAGRGVKLHGKAWLQGLPGPALGFGKERSFVGLKVRLCARQGEGLVSHEAGSAKPCLILFVRNFK